MDLSQQLAVDFTSYGHISHMGLKIYQPNGLSFVNPTLMCMIKIVVTDVII